MTHKNSLEGWSDIINKDDVDNTPLEELEAANDILEREIIIAKLAAKAREKSMAEGSLDYNINKPYNSSYEAGYRDALSRLWNSTANVKDVIRTLARL